MQAKPEVHSNGRHNVMSPRDAAAYLGIGYSSLRALQARGSGPTLLRVTERRIVYRRADLDAWLESRAQAAA